MGYFEREVLLDKSGGSIYKLVILAAKRALELAEGQPKMVEAAQTVKPSTVALKEIAERKIQWQKVKGEK